MEKKLRAALISNGIEGLDQLYVDNERVSYDILEVTRDFDPDLSSYDLLIAPNGTDQVALYRLRKKISQFLAAGKALFCFDG